jgi:hypothetical protein
MDMTLQQEYCGFRPILTAIGHDDGDETSFRVLCWVNYQSKFFMFVFSSAAGNWRIAACHSWSSFGTVAETSEIMLCFSCVRGRLYWTAPCWNKLLVLDTCTMEFSAVDILTSYHMQLINLREQRIWSSSFVLATEGALEMFTLIRNCSLNDLYYTSIMPMRCNGSRHKKAS